MSNLQRVVGGYTFNDLDGGPPLTIELLVDDEPGVWVVVRSADEELSRVRTRFKYIEEAEVAFGAARSELLHLATLNRLHHDTE